MSSYSYRLSWEMADPHWAAMMADTHGKGIFPRLTEEEWNQARWAPVEKIVQDFGEIENQYKTLKAWAETREQPIRNVKLERRQVAEWEIMP